jgi:hypothetical protein
MTRQLMPNCGQVSPGTELDEAIGLEIASDPPPDNTYRAQHDERDEQVTSFDRKRKTSFSSLY